MTKPKTIGLLPLLAAILVTVPSAPALAQADLLKALLSGDTKLPDTEKEVSSAVPAPSAKPGFGELQIDPVPVKVQAVIDPLTFLGENGALYRLTGLDIPGLEFSASSDGSASSGIVAEATKLLTGLIKGQEVKLHVTKDRMTGRANRMGHLLVQAERSKDGLWLQGELLKEGLTRVRTTSANPEMAAAMLALEDSARRQKKGLWAQPDYAVLNAADVSAKANRFTLVEGRVFAVAMRDNETFINFSPDWRKDFSIGVPPEARRAFARQGVNLTSLSHKTIRVRGFIEDRNGPFITLDHPAQLELLDGSAASIATPASPVSSGLKSVKAPTAPKTPLLPDAPKVSAPEKPESGQEPGSSTQRRMND